MTRVDIGVFAHNEADNIARTLQDMMQQEVEGLDVRIVVLANGCSDDTVRRASATAQKTQSHDSKFRIEVVDLIQGGKSRTWNSFVHELSRPDAEVLIFADADIELPQRDSFLRLARRLAVNPELHVFTSRPIKDIDFNPINLGVVDKAIAMASGTLDDWKTAICGQLYAMPALKARLLHLPIGLPVEDGFLRAMVLTSILETDEDFSRIDGDDVFHIFASERSVLGLVRHQTRIVIGSAINASVFAFLHNIPSGQRSAALADISTRNTWLADVIRSQLPRWPYGWIPTHFLTKRIRRLIAAPEKTFRPKKIFVMLLGLGFDTVVYINAQIKMARGAGAHFW